MLEMKPLELGQAIGEGLGAMAVALAGAGFWRKFRNKPNREAVLLAHPFFGSMRFAIAQKIPHLPIARPMRKAVFQDLLRIKLTIWLEHTRAWVLTVSDQHPQCEFEESIYVYLHDTIQCYEGQILAEGIPPVALDLFREWHKIAVSHVLDFVREVCRCPLYETNVERAVVILTALEVALSWTLIDAGRALTSLNGQLDGVRYRGLIDHCAKRTKCHPCTLERDESDGSKIGNTVFPKKSQIGNHP